MKEIDDLWRILEVPKQAVKGRNAQNDRKLFPWEILIGF